MYNFDKTNAGRTSQCFLGFSSNPLKIPKTHPLTLWSGHLLTSPCLLTGESCTTATVLVGFTCTTHYFLNCFDYGKCLTMLFSWIKTQQANTRAQPPPVMSRLESGIPWIVAENPRFLMKSNESWNHQFIERILQNAARIEQGLVKDYGRGTPKNAVRHRETVQNTM